jgi:pyruvate/2-oxoglutarate dehydrogenase complex dihydrolipoamide dehydrogenase (E3) component
MAGMVVENALFGGDCQFDHTLIPWATFTEPEVAHTGLYERDFAERGIECETYKTGLEHCDRAILESATEGFVKIHVLKGTDTILGEYRTLLSLFLNLNVRRSNSSTLAL